jgi:hypothetical protein
VKAVSVRQPWAELIVRGAKSVELRTWYVAHRGALAIHASAERQPERVRALGLDPDALAYGALIGVVQLVDIAPLGAAEFESGREQHLADGPMPSAPCFGWRLAEPCRLMAAVPLRGRMGLFNVPDALVAGGDGSPAPVEPIHQPDPGRPFVLYALPEGGGGYRLALYQWPFKDTAGGGRKDALAPGALWGMELGGDRLRAVMDQVLGALRANGHRPSDLARSSQTPFYLDETTGLRLALTFMAVKPLTRFHRIEQIQSGVHDMGDEEAYYWFSKCSAGPHAVRAQHALRVLLAAE